MDLWIGNFLKCLVKSYAVNIWFSNLEHGTWHILRFANPLENQEKYQQKQATEIKALIPWVHITIFQLKYVIGLAKSSSKIIFSNAKNARKINKFRIFSVPDFMGAAEKQNENERYYSITRINISQYIQSL